MSADRQSDNEPLATSGNREFMSEEIQPEPATAGQVRIPRAAFEGVP